MCSARFARLARPCTVTCFTTTMAGDTNSGRAAGRVCGEPAVAYSTIYETRHRSNFAGSNAAAKIF